MKTGTKLLVVLILLLSMAIFPCEPPGVMITVITGYLGILLMKFSVSGYLQLKKY